VDDLNATATQQAVVNGLLSLPWALKIGCGFLSDAFPIMGLRRKPYFLIGWGLFFMCNLILALLKTPSIGALSLLSFISTIGFVQADVCNDAMIVERSQLYETAENRGVDATMLF
jgi:MFS-type transporter involved in bile tolerance (Atg22 family)